MAALMEILLCLVLGPHPAPSSVQGFPGEPYEVQESNPLKGMHSDLLYYLSGPDLPFLGLRIPEIRGHGKQERAPGA